MTLKSGSLPKGLTLSEAGVLEGAPTEDGTFTFTVQAENKAGVVEHQVELKVAKPRVEPPVVNPGTPVCS